MPKRLDLNAQAFAGSVFTGWQGDCSGTGACQLDTDRSFDVTVTFVRLVRITVLFRGEGSGHVASIPEGIDCPVRCSTEVVPGSTFTLQTTPEAGSAFVRWRGACEGSDTCAVAVNSRTTVEAEFSSNVRPPPPVASGAAQCAGLAPTEVERHQFVQPPFADECGDGYGDGNGTLFFDSVLASADAHAGYVAFLRGSGTFLDINLSGEGGFNLQQPSGLIRLSDSHIVSSFVGVVAWDSEGNALAAHASLYVFGVPQQAFFAADPAGGALIAGDFSFDVAPERQHAAIMFGSPPSVRWGPSPLASKGVVQGVGVDVLGRSLVITDGSGAFGAGILSGQWFESDGSARTGEFSLGPSGLNSGTHWLETSPLIGGGLLIQAFEFKGEISATPILRPVAVIPSGSRNAEQVPEWIASRSGARFQITRGGRAYAVLPFSARGASCTPRLEVLDPSGTWCGSQQFPIANGTCDPADLTLGADGTVMQRLPRSMETETWAGMTSCTWRWWPGALR